jgi:hypothetical protein
LHITLYNIPTCFVERADVAVGTRGFLWRCLSDYSFDLIIIDGPIQGTQIAPVGLNGAPVEGALSLVWDAKLTCVEVMQSLGLALMGCVKLVLGLQGRYEIFPSPSIHPEMKKFCIGIASSNPRESGPLPRLDLAACCEH